MADVFKKTRAEREAELQSLWKRPGGMAQVIDLYREATGSPAGTIPNSGALIIRTILDKEFPTS
jgi:hypothetical protein